jgi:hypothetical protein
MTTTVTPSAIRNASSEARLPMLQALYADLTGLDASTAGNTNFLFGAGRGGNARISITADTVSRQLAEMDRIHAMGGNIRFCVERLVVEHSRTPYTGITYLN